MKSKLYITFLCIHFCVIVCNGQNKWELIQTYSVDSNSVWNVDVLGNVYVTKNDLLQKFDSVGILKFSQSQKSIGKISSIQPINTMKLIVFSEEQQEYCVLDNTLTRIENCVDLSEKDISYASFFVVSAQPDKYWVYDQLNSRFHLVSHGQTGQNQDIENLKGILNSNNFSFVLEQNYQLYLVDSLKGVYILDLYGTLLDFLPERNVLSLSADEKFIYLFRQNDLKIIQKETMKSIEIKMPEAEILDFKKNGSSFYFKTKTNIKKFKLFF
ncbi:MAG: hypothetical protein HYR91_07605 [Flavobacteriia bacterium]|nr:hypothetical protein [Flavobacteriia bacterium]